MASPILFVMAGPNGSGKSTITSEYEIIGDYVNGILKIMPNEIWDKDMIVKLCNGLYYPNK